MRKKFAKVLDLFLVLILSFSLVSCSSKSNQEDIVTGLKTGNYSYNDFKNNYILTTNLMMQQNGFVEKDKIENLLSQVINGITYDEIIKRQIIQNEVLASFIEDYCNQKGSKVSKEDIDKGYENFKKLSVDSDENMQEFLKLNNIDEDYLKSVIRTQIYSVEFTKLINEDVYNEVENNPDILKQEIESVSAKHILVQTEDEAKKIEERLKNGENFEELAKELSQDTGSAKYGGELGSFQRGMMIPEFENAAFSMNVGDISEPVQSVYGYHIIKLENKTTYADVLDEITKKMDALKDDDPEEKVKKENFLEEYNITKDQLIYSLTKNKINEMVDSWLSATDHKINEELLAKKIDIKFPEIKQDFKQKEEIDKDVDKVEDDSKKVDKKDEKSSDK